MVLMLREYMMNRCILLGFNSLVNRMATDSSGTAKDITPGTKAIVLHMIAFDVAWGPR